MQALRLVQLKLRKILSYPLTIVSCLQAIIEQGGLQPGGLNFDAKVRRESTDVEDMFIAHIGKMSN